jgi:hypothetical protein
MAQYTGLAGGITAALLDTYKLPFHAPGRVFTDLAVAVADGADAISGISVLGDRQDLFGPVASMPTTWRVLDRIDSLHPVRVRQARGRARARAWAAGAGPDLGPVQETQQPTTSRCWTWRSRRCPNRPGHGPVTPMVRSCWRAAIRPARPMRSPPHAPSVGRVLLRIPRGHTDPTDCRRDPEECWHPALQTDHGDGNDLRDGAWVAEATGMINLDTWPDGSRLILREERPHPGAQLTFTDVDGMRITAILTNTGPGVVPGQGAGLELRHRQHAPVEDRIREAKATGLRNLPCRGARQNAAWLEAVLTAVDLVCWTKLICFGDIPELARCEIAAFRYRILHVAARLTHGARQLRLRIDKTWRWAVHIAEGFHRLRTAFG